MSRSFPSLLALHNSPIRLVLMVPHFLEEEAEASEVGYMKVTIHKPKPDQPGAWGLLWCSFYHQ